MRMCVCSNVLAWVRPLIGFVLSGTKQQSVMIVSTDIFGDCRCVCMLFGFLFRLRSKWERVRERGGVYAERRGALSQWFRLFFAYFCLFQFFPLSPSSSFYWMKREGESMCVCLLSHIVTSLNNAWSFFIAHTHFYYRERKKTVVLDWLSEKKLEVWNN